MTDFTSGIILGLGINLEVTTDASAFGMVLTPPYDQSDLADDLAKNQTGQKNNVAFVPGIGMILSPTYESTDTMLTDWGCSVSTGMSWDNPVDSETYRRCLHQIDATPGATFSAQMDAELPWGSSGWVKIGRGMVSTSDAVDTLVQLACDQDPMGDGSVPIQILLNHDEPPTVQYGVAIGSGGWIFKTGAVSQKYAKSQELWKGSRSIWIGWWTFNAQNAIVVCLDGEWLVVRGVNTSTATTGTGGIITNAGSNIAVASGSLKVSGTNGTCQVGYFPMQFAETGSFTFGPVQLDFTYGGNGSLSLPGASIPSGCGETDSIAPWTQGSYTDTTGNQIQYTINLTGPGTTTPTIPQVDLRIPAVTVNASMTEVVQFTEADICEFEEHNFEDRNEMMDPDGGMVGWGIRSEVFVKFKNSNGFFTGAGGAHACCQFSRGLTVYDPGSGQMVPLNPGKPYVVFLTGWCGDTTSLDRQDPGRYFHMVLRDKTWPLIRCAGRLQRYNDGFCYQAAMRLQLERAGILDQYIDTTSDAGFGTCEACFNPPGCTHYKLPIGTAQQPLMGFDPSAKFWHNMMWIAGHVHEVVWPDYYGVFHRYPYRQWVTQGNNQGVYTTGSVSDPADPRFLMTVSNLNLLTDTADKRTMIETVGVNPATNHFMPGSINIDDQPGFAGYTLQYHGFIDPLFVASRLFCDPVAQQTIMQAMMSKIMLANNTFQGTFHFLPNDWVYDNFTIGEGVPIGGTNYVVPVGGMQFTQIKRKGVYRYNPDGRITLYSEKVGRWTPNN